MWESIASPKRQQESLWSAVPSVKKIDTFSHSLGRKRPFKSVDFEQSERPLSGKADILEAVGYFNLIHPSASISANARHSDSFIGFSGGLFFDRACRALSPLASG